MIPTILFYAGLEPFDSLKAVPVFLTGTGLSLNLIAVIGFIMVTLQDRRAAKQTTILTA